MINDMSKRKNYTLPNGTMRDMFITLANEYYRAFCEKHDISFDPNGWVGGIEGAGTVACPEDLDAFIDFEVIRYDIDNCIARDQFFMWHEWDSKLTDLEVRYDKVYNPKREEGRLKRVNYRSWCSGAPLPYSDVDLIKMGEDLNRMYEEKMRILKVFDDDFWMYGEV